MSDENADDKIPPGFRLRHTLRGHDGEIRRIAWSPDGRTLASGGYDRTIRLWDTGTGQMHPPIKGHTKAVYSVAWSPDGGRLASGSRDLAVRLWDTTTRQLLRTLVGHPYPVLTVAWSPDGRLLASGSDDSTVRIWDTETGELLRTMQGHFSPVHSVAWSPGGQILASASDDGTVRIWDTETGDALNILRGHHGEVYGVAWLPGGRALATAGQDGTVRLWNPLAGSQQSVLEGHTRHVTDLACSADGKILASASWDHTVRLWRLDRQEAVAVLQETSAHRFHVGLAFDPQGTGLATLGERATAIHVWDLDWDVLLGQAAAPEVATDPAPITVPVATIPMTGTAPVVAVIPTVHYANAKVVLVGDASVGKTCLGRALLGESFAPQESTHGRHVWAFDNREVQLADGRQETHETLLWDLAGQPGYRLIHQLHLDEVAVALVIFDGRSETDPFAGVRHWDRALRQALRVQGDAARPMIKFLVAARTDRGGIGVSRERVDALVHALGFDGYFETSAKEGWGIDDLAEAMREALDWEALPKVSSTELFQQIKVFLVEEKQAGRALSTVDDLYRVFLRTKDAPDETGDLRAQFEICIGRVQSRGLIQRLSFGDLVLLQPELLDAYTSAMVNAAKEEPDGLGCIAEEDALAGRFKMPEDERIEDRQQERLLLIAAVEEMLCHEIALREQTVAGPVLVFPSQFTREWPEAPDPEGKAVVFRFDGPLLNIYATLTVRLARSGFFIREEMWKDAAVYGATVGGHCGVWLREVEEGRGELTLFFDAVASEATRFQFEEYIHTHLQRWALPSTIVRRRIFVCLECGTPVTDRQADLRRERGFDWIRCNVCDMQIPLLDREERLTIVPVSAVPDTDQPTVPKMDHAADAGRERDAAISVLQGKIETGDFDIFLCHNSEDKPAVKEIGGRLKERGILPWLDQWELRPGLPWQQRLEEQIGKIKSAAVFIGEAGIGPWEHMELDAFLRQFVRRRCPVIPVLLPDAPRKPEIPIFLEGMIWVDFRKDDPDPMEQLIWGITGERSRTF